MLDAPQRSWILSAMLLNVPLKNMTFVAFDTETSGAYPLDSELCEIAAVKWQGGAVVDTFQSLIKPTQQMSDFIIGIHGITNEMVANAPNVGDVIPRFHKFIQDSVVVGHHVAFDLGFVAYEFEKKSLMLPKAPALCSSLLSRKLFPQSPNHKLQTLIDFLKLHKGQAHRALDDTKACLDLTLKCFELFGWDKTLEDILAFQGVRLEWENFSLYRLQDSDVGNAIVSAIQKKALLDMSYRSQNDRRRVRPIGVVRNPGGDYMVAYEGADKQHKRFYINKIVSASAV